jgi:hypothetical protein
MEAVGISYCLAVTNKKEIAGADGRQSNTVLLGAFKDQAKKVLLFFHEKVFFYLTSPLMGDPEHCCSMNVGDVSRFRIHAGPATAGPGRAGMRVARCHRTRVHRCPDHYHHPSITRVRMSNTILIPGPSSHPTVAPAVNHTFYS